MSMVAISFRYAQERSGTHNLSALMRAFAITMSLRIKATTATFGGFPESMRLLYGPVGPKLRFWPC
jgi:hypothetical protein